MAARPGLEASGPGSGRRQYIGVSEQVFPGFPIRRSAPRWANETRAAASAACGALAQLAARLRGTQKVSGSTPEGSTWWVKNCRSLPVHEIAVLVDAHPVAGRPNLQQFQPGSYNCPAGGSAPPARRCDGDAQLVHPRSGVGPFEPDCGMYSRAIADRRRLCGDLFPSHAAAAATTGEIQPCSLPRFRDLTARLFVFLGALAQLAERVHGTDEVAGSIPAGSTSRDQARGRTSAGNPWGTGVRS